MSSQKRSRVLFFLSIWLLLTASFNGLIDYLSCNLFSALSITRDESSAVSWSLPPLRLSMFLVIAGGSYSTCLNPHS